MNIGYNGVEVVNMDRRALIKAWLDRLTDEQVQALFVIVESMAWETVEATPEELEAIKEGQEDIKAGRVVKAEDVWRELGI